MGWIGRLGQVTYYLDVMGADKDEEGRHLIGGSLPQLFLGIEDPNNDVVIDDECVYFRNGHPSKLAAGLSSTSYGLKVEVII